MNKIYHCNIFDFSYQYNKMSIIIYIFFKLYIYIYNSLYNVVTSLHISQYISTFVTIHDDFISDFIKKNHSALSLYMHIFHVNTK